MSGQPAPRQRLEFRPGFNHFAGTAISHLQESERRQGRERRAPSVRSLLAGHWLRRRRAGRRLGEGASLIRDWHPSGWLGLAVLVLLLSATDAFLTLTLLRNGAVEINPVMAVLIKGGVPGFAWWKMGLTAFGTLVLTALANVRLFGRIPAGCLLYLVAIGYVVLVCYEWYLLHNYGMNFVSSLISHPVNYPT